MGLLYLLPSATQEGIVMEYRKRALDSGDRVIHGGNGLECYDDYSKWVMHCERLRNMADIEEETPPSTTFLVIDEETGAMVGIANIRHKLTPYMFQRGGHIGYSVDANHRKKGYATEILDYCLDFLRNRGEKKILITCYSENEASRRTIINGGGILENEVFMENRYNERYWVEL